MLFIVPIEQMQPHFCWCIIRDLH